MITDVDLFLSPGQQHLDPLDLLGFILNSGCLRRRAVSWTHCCPVWGLGLTTASCRNDDREPVTIITSL